MTSGSFLRFLMVSDWFSDHGEGRRRQRKGKAWHSFSIVWYIPFKRPDMLSQKEPSIPAQ